MTSALPSDQPVKAEVCFRLVGHTPSAREIADLLLIFEASFVWGIISHYLEGQADSDASANSPHQEHKLGRLREIEASYKDFLKKRYITQLAGLMPSDVIKENGEKSGSQLDGYLLVFPDYGDVSVSSVRETSRSWIESRTFRGEQFSFTDFSDWVYDAIGPRALTTVSIEQGSVKFILDAAVIASFFFMTDHPEIVGALAYAVPILRSWLGKEGGSADRRLPHLDPRFYDTLSEYDEVEYKTEDVSLTLRRSRPENEKNKGKRKKKK